MNKMPFVKMQGLGNDFVMLDGRQLPQGVDLPDLAGWLCDRHFGIGADGLITTAPPSDPDRFDIRFVYLNGDGSWAEMCGNGIRCFARFVRDLGLVDKDTFTAETLAGPISPTLNADGTVTVDMGAPVLVPEDIPLDLSHVRLHQGNAENITLAVGDRDIVVTAVSMGNPHCLVFQDLQSDPLAPEVYGPLLEVHPAFPNKTNVEFIEVPDRKTLNTVVWERGCGFTLACGTGACATAVTGTLLDKTDPRATVNLPGGPLDIDWQRDGDNHVLMTGPAATVFEGQFDLEKVLASPRNLGSSVAV